MLERPPTDLASRRLKLLSEAGRFDECVEEFVKLEATRPLLPSELVHKGGCMQLGSGEVGSLKDIEKVYQKALHLDADYVPALLELGWFHYALNDDAEKALSFFERAALLADEDAAEAAAGKEKCLNEIRCRKIKAVPSESLDGASEVRLETRERELLEEIVSRRCPEFIDLARVAGQRLLTFEEGVNLRRLLSDEYLENGLLSDGVTNEYGQTVDRVFGKLAHLSASR